MALRNQPYIKLFPKDWLSDEKLKECNAESHGILINIMCLMHQSSEYGVIMLKQKYKYKQNSNFADGFAAAKNEQIKNFATQLAKQLPFSLDEIERGLTELIDEDVLQMDGDTLSQKRMVRDANLSDARANAGSMGGKSTANRDNFADGFAAAKNAANYEYDNDNEYDNEPVSVDEKKNVKTTSRTRAKPPKTDYAEFVSMTNDEHSSLVAKVGEDGAARCIEILDNYKGANGKKYKSDYRAILNWVVGRYEEDQARHVPRSGKPPRNIYAELAEEARAEECLQREVISIDPS